MLSRELCSVSPKGLERLQITSCKNPNPSVLERLDHLCLEYPLIKVDRDAKGPLLVVTRRGLTLRVGESKARKDFRWHPGLLHTLRESGLNHPWVKLGEISPGDLVLDCTLGLGTDATFLSEVTEREVIGLELSLPIFLLAQEGLAKANALVSPILCDSTTYLERITQSPHGPRFDILIADPMFPSHLTQQRHSLDVVRSFGDHRTLTPEWLRLAREATYRWVIIKDHRESCLLERLGEGLEPADLIWSKGKRSTRYGRWSGTA